MGMAASQARFLGLTARKSNVEYQGQQVNQQRTALANESANLYSQMMNLTVPTPPAESDFYKTTQVLENSHDSYAASDYQIVNVSKTYQQENEYTVALASKVENHRAMPETFRLDKVSEQEKTINVVDKDGVPVKDENGKIKTETIKYLSIGLVHNSAGTSEEEEKESGTGRVNVSYFKDDTSPYQGQNGALQIETYRIYKADAQITGYNECCSEDGNYFFYQDAGGENHFIAEGQLNEMIEQNEDGSFKNLTKTFGIDYMDTYYTNITTYATGIMEKSKNGRFSSFKINGTGNDNCPENLIGKEFNITTTRVKDEEKYEEAFNDYEYEKYLYEKTISDINAQTEVIQKEDQQLELRLDQLDTEQNAISTEMEAVTKVIEDNVEKTFKIFA